MDERLEHHLNDRTRRGPAGDGSFSGAAGGAPCGDLARLSLVVDGGRINAVSFDAEGCGAMVACAAAAAELAEGATISGAAAISTHGIAEEVGGLSPGKLHAAELAADALHRAISAALAGDAPLEPVPTPDRVLVAMSGGVDSAVAALLEREAGREVLAVTLKLWADEATDGERSCCSPEAVRGARALSHSLGIPHLTLDLEGPFRERVVAEFLQGHADGRTPNPCVRCNGDLRIEAMTGLAQRLGAGALATGHYARLRDDGEGPLLTAAADSDKDQTYMLSALPPRVLARLRFPLAGLRKPEVRAIAADHGLPVASRRESQDLCFLAGQRKEDFLRRHGGLEDTPGEILDLAGASLGSHRGHQRFTVGQRRGIGVAAAEPLYVLATDAAANTVTVGPREKLDRGRVRLMDSQLWRAPERVNRVKLRYRSAAVACRLEGDEVVLDEPFAGVAPGQTACLLDGDLVVGSATIA